MAVTKVRGSVGSVFLFGIFLKNLQLRDPFSILKNSAVNSSLKDQLLLND